MMAPESIQKLTGGADGENGESSGVTVGIGGDDENGVGGEKGAVARERKAATRGLSGWNLLLLQ